MWKRVLITISALAFGLPAAAGAVDLRHLAGCKAGMDDPIVTGRGLVTAHLVCDRLLIEIPEKLYNRDLLLNTEFAAISGGSNFIAPGTVVDNRVVRWVPRGKHKVDLVMVTFEIGAARTSGLERAVEANSLPTTLRTFEVLGHSAKGEAIVDISPGFVKEPPRGFALGFMKHFGLSDVDPTRSHIENIKVFPENVGIRYYQTWLADRDDLASRVDDGEESVMASAGFMFYTNLYLLPEKPMRPRFWDSRVGYFATEFHDYGTGDYGGVSRGFIQRYRLEKRDPKAPLSDPVKPIVFYIGQGVPDVWRPYIKLAVEDWQGVFAQAGFSNAIFARAAPTEAEDPTWDPDDVRHNVIRWTPSGRRNALGAAVVDPRSGEVISSHTLLWHDVLKLLEQWYFTQASPLDPRAQKLPLHPELMGELLRYVLRHEIGHALGLRHNFKATSAVGVKELRDPQWTNLWGTSASTMSYARFNYVAQPGDGAGLVPKFGPYDYFAIEWGYKVFPDNVTPDEEAELLDAIAARQISNPMLRFGGEDEAAEIDPSTYSNVLGSDPIAAGDLGLRNIDRVMSFIVPATTRVGEGYSKLSSMYEALVAQRHRELIYVARLIGGVEETRYQAGRGTAPYAPVVPERQQQAVAFLNERAFIEPKALLDPDVLDRIAGQGGSDPLQGSNVDLLRRLIDPDVFKRMMDASSRGNGRYTGLEMLYDLNSGLFSELKEKSPVVRPYRRQVQRSYVTVLLVATGVVDDPSYSRNIESERNLEKSLDSEQADSGSRRVAKSDLRATRSFDSALAGVGEQYTASAESLSEYRAVIRTAVAALYKQIDAALATTEDIDTQMHLRQIRAELGNVP